MSPFVITPLEETLARREALLARLEGAAVLLVSGCEKTRSHTMNYTFRVDSDFFYLTGFREPDAALLLLPRAGGHEAIAFLRPSEPAAESWNGRRLGLDRAVGALGVDRVYPFREIATQLPGLLRGVDRLCYPLGAHAELDALITAVVANPRSRVEDAPTTVIHPRSALHELRLLKSASEVARLEAACSVTAAGFAAVAAAIRPGVNERVLQGALEGTFLKMRADGPAYGTIVAGGENATILHYTENHAPLGAGELVLIDAGAEVGGYASDVSRTYPVSGKFTALQRQVYEIVLGAQLAAIATLRPGQPFTRYHEVANEVLTAGLVELGVLTGDVATLIAERAYEPYTLHRAGHSIGLDTHDVGRVAPGGNLRPLAAGMVLTVEPGLYFGAMDERVDAALRGLGIRIEDVVWVTDAGPVVLTAGIPKTVEAIEAALASEPRMVA